MVKGGRKEFSGADTCVFVPPVRCDGDTVRTDGNVFVSRIVQKKPQGQEDRDIVGEERVREYFPELVANGCVTVHERSCVPNFQGRDFDTRGSLSYDRGCDQVDIDRSRPGPDPRYVNLLTRKRIGPLINLSLADQRACIEGALTAAVALVPDDGPWIVHVDAHRGNILHYEENGQRRSSLNDWGRIIMIDKPFDIDAFRQGVNEAGEPSKHPRKFWNFDNQQHPQIFIDAMNAGIDPSSTPAQQEKARRYLRGLMAYVIIHFVYRQDYTNLLDCENQAQLLRRVNRNTGLNIQIPPRQGPSFGQRAPPPVVQAPAPVVQQAPAPQGPVQGILQGPNERIDVTVRKIGDRDYELTRRDGLTRIVRRIEGGGNSTWTLQIGQDVFPVEYIDNEEAPARRQVNMQAATPSPPPASARRQQAPPSFQPNGTFITKDRELVFVRVEEKKVGFGDVTYTLTDSNGHVVIVRPAIDTKTFLDYNGKRIGVVIKTQRGGQATRRKAKGRAKKTRKQKH